jgi:Cd2+/Zn2+-exporting ATPase
MAIKRIEISDLLPNLPSGRDRCVQRLIDILATKKGVKRAHRLHIGENDQAKLCIHFDSKEFSAGEILEFAKRAGMDIGRIYGHLSVPIAAGDARKGRSIASSVERIEGVVDASASAAGVMRVEFDKTILDEATLRRSLEESGIAKPEKTSATASAQGGLIQAAWEHLELVFVVLCGLFLGCGYALSFVNEIPSWVPLLAYIGAYFFGGYFALLEVVENLKNGRVEIDFLMLVAAIGAAVLGEWAEGALLLLLFSLGHALEHFAMARAKRAIESLATLAPQTAIVRRDNQEVEVPIDQLKVADVVLVKPNERFPADGFVLSGEGSVNQAPITGESIPVDKRKVSDPKEAASKADTLPSEYRVFVGTINGSDAFEIQVTKLSSESTLARVIKLVSEAQTQRSPTQQFTDRFERYFVPSSLLLVILLLFAWVIVDEPFSASFYRAMAVLVASSPCALAIATPSAVLSGVARAARSGVLIKGGGPLEILGRIGAIAFDKTGTLTEGKPRLVDVISVDPAKEREFLELSIAVEKLSDHPLAAAVVRDGIERIKGEPKVKAEGLQSITGRGVKATVGKDTVYLGKDILFSDVQGPPLPESLARTLTELKNKGRTTMVVRKNSEYVGILGLMDTPRKAAKEVIRQLHQLGVRRMIMLSGDNQQVASAVAREIGIDEALGDLMPDDKVQAIKRLGRENAVAMVGDGVNDAPALANAAVGIAMGAAGSDVALETADIALMSDDLSQLPFAVGLSRQTSRVIRQNLWFSLAVVGLLIPSTIIGLPIGAAILFHEGSTLLVVFNAIRLLAYAASPTN